MTNTTPTTSANTPALLDELHARVTDKLLRLGECGLELDNPPDNANPLWVLGVLASTETLIADVTALHHTAKLLVSESR